MLSVYEILSWTFPGHAYSIKRLAFCKPHRQREISLFGTDLKNRHLVNYFDIDSLFFPFREKRVYYGMNRP
jgi:hypothetical protein